MAEIVILNGVRAGAVFPLPDIPTILGRSPEAHLHVEDPWISSMHAMFERRGGELWVIDLESRNGTFVGDERVAEARVSPGMLLRFGRTEVRVEDRTPTPPPSPEEPRSARSRTDPQRASIRADQTAATGLPRVVREPEEEDPAALTRRSAALLRIALHVRSETAPLPLADLRAALDAAARAALDEGAVAVRLAGGGVLAIFGLGAPSPDDAARALRAARGARAAVRALSGGVVVRVAVDRGPVLAGNLAAPEGFELAALGEAAERIDRLLALARPGEILAGPGAASGASGPRELRRVGSEELEVVRVDEG